MNKEIRIKVDGPFVISSREQRPEYVHAFPFLWKLPDGRLFLSISKERDVYDRENFLLTSDDFGKTWKDTDKWPTAKYPGGQRRAILTIDQYNVFTTLAYSFKSKKKGVYILPAWFSKDGGYSWEPMQSCKLHIPYYDPIDIYNPPEWWRQKHKSKIEHAFIKSKPPKSLIPLYKKFSRKRGPGISQIVKISNRCLIGLVEFPHKQLEQSSVSVVKSIDGGHTWEFLSVVALYDSKYADKSIGQEDGFCEPSMVKLPNSELLVILRMGSYYPLYAVRSKDNGKTWSKPEKISVHGILPTVLIMHNGIVALATGRPDVTLNFSLDMGRSWKYQIKLLEFATGERSTSNTTMVEIKPNKLLYVYDTFKSDKTGKDYWLKAHGSGKIVGYFIEVNI